jgi:hypothetical protein
MIVNGKPVRLILRGDRLEAARWIPYFASKCRAMGAPSWQRLPAKTGVMRGWARGFGEAGYEIYVEVEGGLRYYDVSGFWRHDTPATHQVDFNAWALPDAKLDMLGDVHEPDGSMRTGNAKHLGKVRIMNGYFGDYSNSVTRIGQDLYTVYSGKYTGVFGTLVFKSKDVRKDQDDENVLLELPGVISNRQAVFAKELLLMQDAELEGYPRDFFNCGVTQLRRIVHTPKADAGTISATMVFPLIDYEEVHANGGNLTALTMVRGETVRLDGGETMRVAYLSFFESYDSLNVFYRWVLRIDVETGAILASARVQMPYSTDSYYRRIVGLIDNYIAWEGEVGRYYLFIIGTLMGVSQELREQTYDLYALDRDTLAHVGTQFNCGVTHLGVYQDGVWAMSFDSATFEDRVDEYGRLERLMTSHGAMHEATYSVGVAGPVVTRGRNLGPYEAPIILAGTSAYDRSYTEYGQGFIRRFTD